MSDFWVYGIGLVAQLLFSCRLLIQWVKSEKAGKVLSPTLFWQLSLIASFLLIVYGILRDDLVIIMGQMLSYFIYIRNLYLKNAWHYIPFYFKVIVVCFPVLAIVWLACGHVHNWGDISNNSEVSVFLLTWGSIGQLIFTLRFVYQWYYSEQQQKSIMPTGFWIISLAGSAMIITYGIYRKDPVLILGQAFGFIIYIRNLILWYKPRVHIKRYD